MTGPAQHGDLGGMVARPRQFEPRASEPQPAPAPAPVAADPAFAREPGADTRTLSRTGARRVTTVDAAPAARSTATAAATSLGQARGLAAPASRFPDVDPDSRTGTVYGRSRPELDGPDNGSQRLGPLHVGWHSASLVTLSMMGSTAPAAGLILGEDVDHRAVAVRLFRPEPTLVTLVGSVWAAQVMAFRALAVGAAIVILTDDPVAWRDFAARNPRVTVTGQPPRSGSAGVPTLVIRDFTGSAVPPSYDVAAWETQLTVLRRLDEHGVSALQDGHIVLTQRLYLDEAMLAVTSLRLTGDSALLLQQLEPGMVAVVGLGTTRYLWWATTDTETRLLGPARR
jgi:hypothetical protein